MTSYKFGLFWPLSSSVTLLLYMFYALLSKSLTLSLINVPLANLLFRSVFLNQGYLEILKGFLKILKDMSYTKLLVQI